jgi:pyruvate,water dikinase
MIFPQSSGIMFTADPVSSNRKVLSIDASFGLGEALVSGLVNADIYKVRSGKIVDKQISTKEMAIYPVKSGGTVKQKLDEELQNKQTLTDEQILHLEKLGRNLETHFGCPQDIEWCLSEDVFYIVQSRPITTLYPLPLSDDKNRVYISMGHLQMMTEDIKPLGMSFINMLSYWFGENLRAAGGRLFIDVTHDLASPMSRNVFAKTLGNADILIKNAVDNLLERKDFIKNLPRGKGSITMELGILGWLGQAIKIYRKNDISIVEEIIAHNKKLNLDLKNRIEQISGDELFSFILEDTKEFKSVLRGSQNMSLMMLGGYVSNWINKKMEKWLGEKNTVDILSKSVPNNVTSEMGLDLLDVADVIRSYPDVMEYLDHASNETFFEDMLRLEGGEVVRDTMIQFLEKYGMRCSGEIDITKPRWSEKPSALSSMILSNIKLFQPNTSTIQFEQGRLEAEQKEQELLERLQQLSGGKHKAKKTKKMISILRNFIGFREYPKYSMISRFQIYKTALMNEAEKLVKQDIIKTKEDIYYLYFEELREVSKTKKLDYGIIVKRKEEYERFKKLTPPRVMTSEGEIISGQYKIGNIPQGALVGIPVSSGVVEGRARVLLELQEANLEKGDILVTKFTDPSWTPLFVGIKGLVTEVGGLMTHGAVITREYGLPGVVGVENATAIIKDKQRIRLNGTEGYIELL